MYNDDEPLPTATTDPNGTALTLRKYDGFDDWYVIDRANHDGRSWMEPREYGAAFMCSWRISDADVEGPASEMRRIAEAIETRGGFNAKRCAVRVCGDLVEFWSPRNSMRRGVVTLANADELAAQIRATLA